MNSVNLDRLIRYAIKRHQEMGPPPNRRFRRHFSFLLDGKRVISTGISKDHKTHPVAAAHGYTRSIHSEVDCVLRLDKESDANGKIMFNTRVHRKDTVGMARPCPALCQKFVRQCGIKYVIFTNQDGEIEIWDPED